MAEGDGSFEDRLRAARAKQGLDAQPSPGDKTGGSALDGSPMGIGLKVGAELVSALAVAVAIGWGLDTWLGTKPIFIAVFVLIGGAAGVLNLWRSFAPKA
jgi:ATP synthase protein I